VRTRTVLVKMVPGNSAVKSSPHVVSSTPDHTVLSTPVSKFVTATDWMRIGNSKALFGSGKQHYVK